MLVESTVRNTLGLKSCVKKATEEHGEAEKPMESYRQTEGQTQRSRKAKP